MNHSWIRFWRVMLWLVVLASLVLGIANAVVLLNVKQGWDRFLDRVQRGEGAVPLTVHVDHEIPIQATVPISQMVEVPIDLTCPVSMSVTTSFRLPVLGEQKVVLPVHAVIPISTTVLVPLRAQFPISLTYRLQGDFPVVIKLTPEMILHLLSTEGE